MSSLEKVITNKNNNRDSKIIGGFKVVMHSVEQILKPDIL